MGDHKVESTKAITQGFALGVVGDLRPKNKYNYLQNIRMILEGELRSRKKVDEYLALDYSPDPNPNHVPHSLRTIFNRGDSTVNRIVGIGADLFSGNGSTLTKKDTGFSTEPFTMVDFRPEEATDSYLYIGDKLKFSKVSVYDDYKPVGLDAPIAPLGFTIAKPNRKIIDNIIAADIADWNNLTGSAQVPTIVTRVNTTIAAFLLDESFAPCFASIVPTDPDTDIQNGCILILDGTDEVFVEEVCLATLQTGSPTISRISYDTGVVGLATIVLSTSDIGLKRNSIVKLGGTEYVKVLEVTRDINDIPSIRVNTIATFAIGDSVEGFASFRTYVETPYSVGDTIFAEHLETEVTASGVSSITKAIAIDLTTANSKPLSNDDLLHISLQPADPSVITEIQVQLGYDTGFLENYWYFPVTPNFLLSSALQTNSTLLTIQESIQRQELLNQLPNYKRDVLYGVDGINDPVFDEPIIQTALGENSWTELFIRIGDFIRSGTDSSKTKRNITHIRISINCTAATFVRVDSIWIGGGSTLSTQNAISKFLKYNYIWRVRDNDTKNPSNWSPPLREGIDTNRTNILLTPPTNLFPSDFLVDIARFGGTLNDFRIIGSIKNDGSSFLDTVSDRTAAQNPPAARKLPNDEDAFDFYKPFAILDGRKSGACRVIGTKFTWLSGDKLKTGYPRGVGITINGIFNQFYVNPTDDEHVELENDMGDIAVASFEILAPLLTGQAVQVIFGPWGEGSSGLVIFGLKGLSGTVYWLDGNSPDTMSDLNFLEITSPSEPLIGGLIYDGFPFVFSTRRSFTLYPTYQTGLLSFIARENANSRGILSTYSVCVGRDYIYQISENGDGIYRSQGGGNPQNLTDGSLYNLFMHDGVEPQPVTLTDGTVINPPNFDLPETLRLHYCKDTVIFRFEDTEGKQFAIIFDERINDWISFDTYLDDKVGAFYEEELPSGMLLGFGSDILVGIEGAVGRFAETGTREDEIESVILPFCSDQGDSNLLKKYDEIVIDIDKEEFGGFSFKTYYNNGDLSDTQVDVLGAIGAKRSKFIHTIDRLTRNIANKLSWNLKSLVKFYEEQIYFVPREDGIINRPSDVNNGGFFGEKFWQGIVIEADTFGQDKVLQFFADDDLVTPAAEITINTTGKETKSYSFDQPFIAHSVIRKSIDDVAWVFYNEQYKVDKEPELAKVWEGQETTFDIPGYKVIKRQAIAYRSTAEVRMIWTYDNLVDETYILPSTGGDRGKFFFFLNPRKGKVLRPRLESDEEFRIYRKDCEAWIRGFNLPNDYDIKLPFGDDHRETEVRI